MHIGSRSLAARLLGGTRDFTGFERIGSGGSREAWLHIDSNVVYKHCMYGHQYEDRDYSSILEVRNAQRLRRGNDGFVSSYVRIPVVSGYRFGPETVVAMERVEKSPGRMPDKAYLELYNLGFEDMHEYNYFVSHGYLVPVDMASVRRPGYGDIRTLAGTKYYLDEWNRRYAR